jgi:outer membrane protein, adhesin transport system
MKTRTISQLAFLSIGLSFTNSLMAGTGGSANSSLADAISKALAYDPTLRKVRADTAEAQGYVREVRADRLPQVTMGGSAGAAYRDRSIDGVATGGNTLFSRSINIIGRQLLTDFGYSRLRQMDAKQRLVARDLLDRAQRENTALNTIEAYLDVVRAERQISLAEENVEQHKKVLGLSTDRAKAAGNQADVELSNARYNLASTMLKERRLALAQARAVLFRYTGEDLGSLSMPSAPRIQSREEIDPTRNWHYQAALKQLEAAKLEKETIKRKYGPRIFLEVSGALGEDVLGIEGRDNATSAMVVFSWDLFDGGRRKGQVEQAIADIIRQEAIIHETLVLLDQDIDARWSDYLTINERIKSFTEYDNSLQKTVGLYKEQFDLGTRPLLSMLDVQNEHTSALIRLEDERREQASLAYRLLFFAGRLIPETLGDGSVAPPPITFETSTSDDPQSSANIAEPERMSVLPEESKSSAFGQDKYKVSAFGAPQ